MDDDEMRAWPDWQLADPTALGPYASPEAVADLGLAIPHVRDATKVARAVYNDLRDHVAPLYRSEPWRPDSNGSTQRIRTPAQVARDGGTCLDLALVYAGHLLRSQVRSFVVLVEPGRDEPAGHAFALVDTAALLPDAGTFAELEQAPYPFEPAGAGPAVYRLRRGSALPMRYLPVDVVAAARTAGGSNDTGTSFEEAVVRAESWIETRDTTAVDIVAAQELFHERGPSTHPRQFAPPDNESTPAILLRLPSFGEVTNYPSRAAQTALLASATGRVVIAGDRGLGKSTMARVVARARDGGYGWFLDGSDAPALRDSLARAELQERSPTARGELASVDTVEYASIARQRLEASSTPWVLLVDNADGDPATLLPLLPRTVRPGQSIVVTTTNSDAWRGVWHGLPVTFVEVEPLEHGDVEPEWAIALALTGGSPLLLEALRASLGQDGHGRLDTSTGSFDASTVWRLLEGAWTARGSLTAPSLARLMAFAPSSGLEVADLVALSGRSEAEVEEFLGAGLAVVVTSVRSRTVQMHRLFAAAVREDGRMGSANAGNAVAVRGFAGTDLGLEVLRRTADRAALEALARAACDFELWPEVVRCGVVMGFRGYVQPSQAVVASGLIFLDSPDTLRLKAEGLIAIARAAKDRKDATDEDLILARATAQQAEDVVASIAKPGIGDRFVGQRATAMRLLLDRQMIVNRMKSLRAGAVVEANELRALEADARRVEAALIASRDERQRLADEVGDRNHPDVDRACFNLIGLDIILAQLVPDRADAYARLHRAYRAYGDAARDRRERFGTDMLVPIAACSTGRAVALYYAALMAMPYALVDSPQIVATVGQSTVEDRFRLLRAAEGDLWNALRICTDLAEGGADDNEIAKVLEARTKVTVLRSVLAGAIGRSTGRVRSSAESATAEVSRSFAELGPVFDVLSSITSEFDLLFVPVDPAT